MVHDHFVQIQSGHNHKSKKRFTAIRISTLKNSENCRVGKGVYSHIYENKNTHIQEGGRGIGKEKNQKTVYPREDPGEITPKAADGREKQKMKTADAWLINASLSGENIR